MGFGELVMVLATKETRATLAKSGHATAQEIGDWIELRSPSEVGLEKLSKQLATTVVYGSTHRSADVLRIAAYRGGKLVREVTYCGQNRRGARWSSRGKPLPHEADGDFASWLERDTIDETDEGFDLFCDFLGITESDRQDETSDNRAWRDENYPIPSGNDSASNGRPGPTPASRYKRNGPGGF